MLQILTQSARKRINATAFQILREVGIKLHGKKVLDLLLDAGALPDKSDPLRVYLPDEMVRKYVGSVPQAVYGYKQARGKHRGEQRRQAALLLLQRHHLYAGHCARKAVEIGGNELTDFVGCWTALNMWTALWARAYVNALQSTGISQASALWPAIRTSICAPASTRPRRRRGDIGDGGRHKRRRRPSGTTCSSRWVTASSARLPGLKRRWSCS